MSASPTAVNPLLRDIKTLLASNRLHDAEELCRNTQETESIKAAAWEAIGDSKQDVGKLAEASRAYSSAAPHRTPARVKLALCLIRLGQQPSAFAELQKCIETDPTFAPAQLNMGVLLAESGRKQEALAFFQKAVDLAPDYSEAHINLGRTLLLLDQYRRAVPHLRVAVAVLPDQPDIIIALGTALLRSGEPGQAYAYFRQALRLGVEQVELYSLLNDALVQLGRFEEAEKWISEALKRRPKSAELHCTYGSTCKMRGRIDEALASYELALAYEPGNIRARWNRSLALLHRGDYQLGWADYDVRMSEPYAMRIKTSQPMWDGSPLNGKTLLVHPEQGFGDVLQFVRYVPLIRERFGAGRVIMMCPTPLLRVIKGCPGLEEVIPEDPTFAGFDEHIPLLSLPHRFGTTLANIPGQQPYILPEPDRVAHWTNKLAELESGKPQRPYRIGIVWTGNPHNTVNRFRLVPLHAFEPIARIPNVQLYNLQRIFGLDQLALYGQRLGVIDPAPHLSDRPEDFADTAALIANLDLVITVCTSVAHLAGAMGAKTWLALSTNADWRWLLHRPDSPWYPTLQIFRQQEIDRWDTVFHEMSQALQMQ